MRSRWETSTRGENAENQGGSGGAGSEEEVRSGGGGFWSPSESLCGGSGSRAQEEAAAASLFEEEAARASLFEEEAAAASLSEEEETLAAETGPVEAATAAAAPLPQATSLKARQNFFADFQRAYMKHTVPQRGCNVQEALPSEDQLNRIRYSVNLLPQSEYTCRRMLRAPCMDSKGNRFWHRWGSDRFMNVHLPGNNLTKRHLEDFDLCGRQWSLLTYLKRKETSKRSKSSWHGEAAGAIVALVGDMQQQTSGGHVDAVFFAENGTDLEPVSVWRVREWHLPLDYARGMTLGKFAERFRLAFSTADRTIRVPPEKIHIMDDLTTCEGSSSSSSSQRPPALLTDGNGLISGVIVDELGSFMGHPGRRISAVQVRLGPAKGMLVRWDIEGPSGVWLTRSMVKYGDDDYFRRCDECQTELEIVDVVFADAEFRNPPRLNIQLVLVLQALGCPAQVFLDLEEAFRAQIEKLLLSSEALLQSDFLPTFDGACTHPSSDLCRSIWSLLMAGMEPSQDEYLFSLLKKYAATVVRTAREEARFPLPNSWTLKMVSDFSGKLPAGTMSAWVTNHGFLTGEFLVTRLPCAHVGDIVRLRATDVLRHEHRQAYENVIVLSTDKSLRVSDASRMSGGDFDGDEAIVIGHPPIVNSVTTVDREETVDVNKPAFGFFQKGSLDDVFDGVPDRPDARQAAMSEALRVAAVVANLDGCMTGIAYNLFIHNADWDISKTGKFSQQTLACAKLQELALDAAKTNWRMERSGLSALERPMPRWAGRKGYPTRPRARRGGTSSGGCSGGGDAVSSSALGQIFDLPDPALWVDQTFGPRGPVPQRDGRLMCLAERKRPRQEAVLAFIRSTWDVAWGIYSSDKRDIKKYREKNLTAPMTHSQAIARARSQWVQLVDERHFSRVTFALTVYFEKRGFWDVWHLCLNELCQAFAEARTYGHLGAGVAPIAYGVAPVTLRSSRRPEQAASEPFFGPTQLQPELLRGARVLRNANIMHGASDGGDLLKVPREDTVTVPVEEIRFTHFDVSDHFKDGRPLVSTLDDLIAGRAHPLTSPFLVLDVVRVDDILWTFRNRRLAILKAFAGYLHQQGSDVDVDVRVHMLSPSSDRVIAKYVESKSTQCHGVHVVVRRSTRSAVPYTLDPFRHDCHGGGPTTSSSEATSHGGGSVNVGGRGSPDDAHHAVQLG
eukprot:TRINITY_DN11320_c0_g1_i9.p1 TRINITY_DN11320_c0_g1~~TRINITY_DN11320_c0_g1_i9.p1  ORF type:complete len:1182 (-),score=219.67 TRINITY_DN11320_c0_g1_i9:15-3560(-)